MAQSPRFGIIAQFKNEAMGIREWLEHYKQQGIDKILLLDNNSTDNWRDQVKDFQSFIDVISVAKNHAQTEHYNKYGMPWLKENAIDIVGVVDLDEYVFGTDGKTIKEHLTTLFADDTVGTVKLTWRVFGSSGHTAQPKSIRTGFTWRKKDDPSLNVKCFSRVRDVITLHIHAHEVKGREIRDPPGLQLNHYGIQSKEFFEKVKMVRGDGQHSNANSMRNWDFFQKHDYKDVEDTQLKQQVEAQQKGGGFRRKKRKTLRHRKRPTHVQRGGQMAPKKLTVVFICHDQKSVDQSLAALPEAKVFFVGNQVVTPNERVTVVRDLPSNIESEKKLLTFTAWYAISKNSLFKDSDYICLLEWDVTLNPNFLATLQNECNASSADILSFNSDSHNFFTDIRPDVLSAFLKKKGIDSSPYTSSLTWNATTNHCMRRPILDEFVDWYYPAVQDIQKEDPRKVSWYHERLFAVFVKNKKYVEKTLPILHHNGSNSHATLNMMGGSRLEKRHKTRRNIQKGGTGVFIRKGIQTGGSIHFQITFGIVTKDGVADEVLQSIKQQNIPEYEIIIVGGPSRYSAPIRHIEFDESSGNYLNKKKNIIVNEAKYENLVIMHDYFRLDPDWYNGFKKYGKFPEYGVNKIKLKNGDRFRDYTLFPRAAAELDPSFNDAALLPYDFVNTKKTNKYLYISGGYVLSKKSILQKYPYDDKLQWNQEEDIVLGKLLNDNGIIIECNPYSTTWITKDKGVTHWNRQIDSRQLEILTKVRDS